MSTFTVYSSGMFIFKCSKAYKEADIVELNSVSILEAKKDEPQKKREKLTAAKPKHLSTTANRADILRKGRKL